MSRRNLIAALVIGPALFGLAACGSSDQASSDCKPKDKVTTISEGRLTIAVYDQPPTISTTGKDGYSGVDADIINKFAEQQCLKVVPKPVSASTIVTGVQTKKFDVGLGGWARTAERAKVVSISDPAYIDKLAFIASDKVATFDELKGKTVGVVDGYAFVQDVQKLYGNSNVKLYPSPLEVAQDLAAGRIDAAVDTYTNAPFTYDKKFTVTAAPEDERVEFTMTPLQLAMLFPKDETQLVEAFNQFLAESRDDGTIASILEKHGIDPSLAEVGEFRPV